MEALTQEEFDEKLREECRIWVKTASLRDLADAVIKNKDDICFPILNAEWEKRLADMEENYRNCNNL